MNRRDFLRTSGMLAIGASCISGMGILNASLKKGPTADNLSTKRKWGMVIDLHRCSSSCTACVEACRKENNVAFHGDKRWDIYWIRKISIKRKDHIGAKVKSVPLLCNHCDNPPCAQVCPVQATYKRDDGVVIVDHHRCIGCRYCMIACPYNVRYFNFKENPDWPNKKYPKRSHGVAESCTFCSHLINKGEKPACVQACDKVQAGALAFGDLNDPDSNVSKLIKSRSVKRIREDLGSEPKVYYIGL